MKMRLSYASTSSPCLLSVSVVLLLLGTTGGGNAAIQPDCVTPIDHLGRCVESRFCVSIMTALINNDHLTNPEVAKFLRESQCGLERNSHRVCCDVQDIDFGVEKHEDNVETTTLRLNQNLEPPKLTPIYEKQLPEDEICGAMDENDTPLKWIGELWFEVETSTGVVKESKCLGTLISRKHFIVPAHCVASLPENTTLDFVQLQGRKFTALKIFIHASYNQPKFANDIAIIEIDRENDDEINDAVCLPVQSIDENDLKSTIAVVKRASGPLKFGKTLLSTSAECTSYFNQQLTELTPGQFCANVQSNDTIYSPFIGAIAIQSDTKRVYSFKGFTSTAIRSGQAFDESKPYIFTEIAHHLNWIQTVIGDEWKKYQKPIANVVGVEQSLASCSALNSEGKCVQLHQCSLYRDAPTPLSPKARANLENAKCYTTAEANRNDSEEDGFCCPSRYIELNYTNPDIDLRFLGKRGVDLLDMQKCGRVEVSRRIVGGSEAGLKEFPWIGLIKYRIGRTFKYTCGSSFITDKYVLTCAHCISALPPGYEIIAVRFGEYDRTTDPDCRSVDENQQECNPPVQDISIEQLIPHPNYNTPRYANDVGLMRLNDKPDMTQAIIPICLPINAQMQEVGNKYTVAGFGFTENNRDSDVLLKVILPKVSKETCQSFHGSVIKLSEGHECYGGEGVRDSCKGDSGNPLMNYVNVKGRLKAVQIGIVVAGHSECGRGASGFPGIYSDINHYMEWILDNLNE